MTAAAEEEVTYLGYQIIVRADQMIVFHGTSRTRAHFRSMAAARSFIRWLRRHEDT